VASVVRRLACLFVQASRLCHGRYGSYRNKMGLYEQGDGFAKIDMPRRWVKGQTFAASTPAAVAGHGERFSLSIRDLFDVSHFRPSHPFVRPINQLLASSMKLRQELFLSEFFVGEFFFFNWQRFEEFY
jgi:hypothetical protein